MDSHLILFMIHESAKETSRCEWQLEVEEVTSYKDNNLVQD